MPLDMEVELSPFDIVLGGPPREAQNLPQFSAYIYCGQTVV